MALAPTAAAGMLVGNYEVETTRDPGRGRHGFPPFLACADYKALVA
jgi:hypothetical protein